MCDGRTCARHVHVERCQYCTRLVGYGCCHCVSLSSLVFQSRLTPYGILRWLSVISSLLSCLPHAWQDRREVSSFVYSTIALSSSPISSPLLVPPAVAMATGGDDSFTPAQLVSIREILSAEIAATRARDRRSPPLTVYYLYYLVIHCVLPYLVIHLIKMFNPPQKLISTKHFAMYLDPWSCSWSSLSV